MEEDVQTRRGRSPVAALARMRTGAKVFLILVVALLPLALIALFTTLQTARTADNEAREGLRALTAESSGVLANVLVNHVAELRAGLTALEADRDDAPACTRIAGAYASLGDNTARFAVLDGRGRLLCGQPFRVSSRAVLQPGQVEATLVGGGLAIRIAGRAGANATAYYPVAALAALSRPSGFVPEYDATLIKGEQRLVLRKLAGGGPLERRETLRADLGVDGLELQMAMPGAQITSPLVIATVLLVLMWIAAAAIAWSVVDILLIRPLRRLRRAVGEYKPGEVIDPSWSGRLPAAELRELGDTFRELSRTVRDHEAGLAEGLGRQTRLTREVHHRVKNNLQVISSLINFHARGAKSPEASEAYASIQRRVDALAVVHRHHYAELEENRGLELRSVVGELGSNLRATAPDGAGLGITLDVAPFLVNQDVAVAVAFLITELVELAMGVGGPAQVRISVKADETAPDRAVLRVSSPSLVDGPQHGELLENRYGRVIGGLARQLRTKLHHDPLVGAYEATIAVTGRS